MAPMIFAGLMAGAMLVADAPPAGPRPQARPFGFDTGNAGICGAAAVEHGKPIPDAMLLRARENPLLVRILRAGDNMTMDFRPDRLTIVIDDKGRVMLTRCG